MVRFFSSPGSKKAAARKKIKIKRKNPCFSLLLLLDIVDIVVVCFLLASIVLTFGKSLQKTGTDSPKIHGGIL